jgi:uncharacterized protein
MSGKHKLTPSAVNVWRFHGVIEIIIYGLVLIVLLFLSLLNDWPLWIVGILFLSFLLYSPFRINLLPKIRLDHFYYEIKEDEIDIQDGIFVIRRILIPIVKIQKVSISQGPILKKNHLANVTIYTGASEETIPALPYKSAESIRNYITQLVKVTEEDE